MSCVLSLTLDCFVCLQALAQKLLEVCKNPMQPVFSHYLFEAVAALIKYTCVNDQQMLNRVQDTLFPAFDVVLQQDVQEFHPYVFQIFAQLIEMRPQPLPDVYRQLFPPMLNHVIWERQGNVPALTRLIKVGISIGDYHFVIVVVACPNLIWYC